MVWRAGNGGEDPVSLVSGCTKQASSKCCVLQDRQQNQIEVVVRCWVREEEKDPRNARTSIL